MGATLARLLKALQELLCNKSPFRLQTSRFHSPSRRHSSPPRCTYYRGRTHAQAGGTTPHPGLAQSGKHATRTPLAVARQRGTRCPHLATRPPGHLAVALHCHMQHCSNPDTCRPVVALLMAPDPCIRNTESSATYAAACQHGYTVEGGTMCCCGLDVRCRQNKNTTSGCPTSTCLPKYSLRPTIESRWLATPR